MALAGIGAKGLGLAKQVGGGIQHAAGSGTGAARQFVGTRAGKLMVGGGAVGGAALIAGCSGTSRTENTDAIASDIISRFDSTSRANRGNGDGRIEAHEAHIMERKEQTCYDGSFFPLRNSYTSHSSAEAIVRAADRDGNGADQQEIANYLVREYDRGNFTVKKDHADRNTPNGTLEGHEVREMRRHLGNGGYKSWNEGYDPHFNARCANRNSGGGHYVDPFPSQPSRPSRPREDRSGNWGRGPDSTWEAPRSGGSNGPSRSAPSVDTSGGRRRTDDD